MKCVVSVAMSPCNVANVFIGEGSSGLETKEESLKDEQIRQ